ncbi:hypothetical protein BDB00DRAFT_848993 [Zychaea mexicana]|uniref:uncharacterized protein n=1 Tax=Zychaea mexicana TaxID=64656 RepID=UPI0022FE3878|nr:uncharacterized protein BDB00DRAFT_848993 [Zychaea mexicana]KAI9488290.1 hypothetical protein BDB00DRAFT_848993 [Zychaea mexicana]
MCLPQYKRCDTLFLLYRYLYVHWLYYPSNNFLPYKKSCWNKGASVYYTMSVVKGLHQVAASFVEKR